MPVKLFRKLTKTFFIATNFILAIMFLLGCYGGHFNANTWWPLGFLTLAAFYTFLFLLLFIVFWLFTKPRWSLISIIAVIAGFYPLQHIIPFRFSSSFSIEKKEETLRVMSWNVAHFSILEHKTHPEKKQEMLDLIKGYQPDVACFEEVVGNENDKTAINYIPDILAQLECTGYHYSYNRKLDFDDKHHFGIITFSKLPIVKKETIQFHPFDYNSIFQFTDVVKGLDTVRIFNVHLESMKFSADNLQYIGDPEINDGSDLKKSKNIVGKLKRGFLNRKIQADRVRAEIDKSPYPVIVCGDFNDVPNSYAYNTIGGNLQNAFAKKGSGIGRTYSSISPTLRIDNIFAAEEFEVLQYTRIGKKMSDHFPVLADVVFKK